MMFFDNFKVNVLSYELKSKLPSKSYYFGSEKLILNDYVKLIGCEDYVCDNILSHIVDYETLINDTIKTITTKDVVDSSVLLWLLFLIIFYIIFIVNL